MKILNLIIKVEHLKNIVAGTKKIETREIRPKSASKYIDTETGAIKKYDAIRFFGGYNTDRPEALVMVGKAEIFVQTDAAGKDIVYKENGLEYVAADIDYHLLNVVEHKNL